MLAVENLKLYTVEELSGMLKARPVTIRAYIRSGKLKAQKVSGKWYVANTKLQEFLEGMGTNESGPRSSTAESILEFIGTWSGPKEEYDVIIKAIKDADTKAEF